MTPASNPVPPLRFVRTRRYVAGLRVWHQHLRKFDARSFNPYADTRFAAVGAIPSLAMFYGGSTPSCALWETVLRDVRGSNDGYAYIPPERLAGRRLTPLRTTRELRLVELFPGPLRGMVDSDHAQDAWHRLTSTPVHAETHAPALETLKAAAAQRPPLTVDGFIWFSRQAGVAGAHPISCVLYAPPAGEDLFEIDATVDVVELDAADGSADAVIERALADASLRRLYGGPIVDRQLADDTGP